MLYQELSKNYRENILPEYFNNPDLTSFDFNQKNICSIPFNSDIQQKITRARFISCGLTKIPDGLDQYPQISIMDLAENFISQIDQNYFQKFTNLQSLSLVDNKLTNFKLNLTPTIITLDLSYNSKINIEDVWNLELPNLEVIKLTHCRISSLPSTKPKWISTVRAIHLDGNMLTEIPPYFDEIEVLEEISLFGNKFTTIDLSLLPQEFKTVNLSFNQISEWESEDIINATTLNLNRNLFTSFPSKVLQTNNLKALLISHCKIKGELDIVIPESISAIDLSYNQIQSLGPNFVASLTKITALNLSHNKILTISDSFPSHVSMTRLIIDFNALSELPSSFVNCTRLEQLTISNNHLKKLPQIALSNLRIFNASFNELDELPDCFGKSTFLSDFNVAFNKLTTLPQSMINCRKIVDFNASGNLFKVFPKVLFSFPQLKTLILSSNQLSTIPISLQSLFFLQTLDLSNNHFTQIPGYVSSFMSMKVLSMAHNLIEELPNDFTFPSSLTVLDLSYNKLTKFNFSLPSCLSLNIDCNSLSEFEAELFPAARFISINNNPLKTPLPQLITSLFQLQKLTTFEVIKCSPFDGEVPPLRFHLISDSTLSIDSRFGIGYSATMGVRPSMEDAITFQKYDNNGSLFALFDGHQGNVAAANSAVCLHNEINQRYSAVTDNAGIPNMLQDSFTAVNKKLKQMNVRDGCTAVAAFIKDRTCYTVGVGDSRIVRVRLHSEERATTDYKPTMRTEYERLRELGITVNAEGRIGRKLAVARSMGDFWCYTDDETPSDTGALYVVPDVKEFELDESEENPDIGLIIACDGVWDVITDHNAAEIVRQCYNKTKSAQDAASQLRNIAFALGSKDNISCIVVFVKPSEEKRGIVYQNEIEVLTPVVEEVQNEDDLNLPPPTTANRRRRR